jgi:hypothetical protein
MTHELKTWDEYFEAIWNHTKTFEVRNDDRKYETGDMLTLRETVKLTGEYTGRAIFARVTYLIRNCEFAPTGKVVMSIATDYKRTEYFP